MTTKNLPISWKEVEKALSEETPSGYKVACIESRKNFFQTLKNNNLPTDNLKHFLKLFSWKFDSPESVKRALEVTDKVIGSLDYSLSTFEAEDTVESFKKAIENLEKGEHKITWQKKLMMSYAKTENNKSISPSKIFMYLLGFIFLVKFLTDSSLGQKISLFSNKVYSLLITIFFVVAVIFIIVLLIFLFLERGNKTNIKNIIEK